MTCEAVCGFVCGATWSPAHSPAPTPCERAQCCRSGDVLVSARGSCCRCRPAEGACSTVMRRHWSPSRRSPFRSSSRTSTPWRRRATRRYPRSVDASPTARPRSARRPRATEATPIGIRRRPVPSVAPNATRTRRSSRRIPRCRSARRITSRRPVRRRYLRTRFLSRSPLPALLPSSPDGPRSIRFLSRVVVPTAP